MSYFYRAIFLIFTVIIIPNITYANEFDIVRQFFFQGAPDKLIQPNVAQPTVDGGFVIAGKGFGAAWVAKLDNQGQTLWQYKTSIRETNAYPIGFSEFRGIAAMGDGSTYLCGYIPRPKGDGFTTALLTHLDQQGRMLNEQLVMPQGNLPGSFVASSFSNCTTEGNGVVVVGEVIQLLPGQGVFGGRNTHWYHWVLKLDGAGKILWQKFIPFPTEIAVFSPIPQETSLLKTERNLVLSATDNNDTDILSFTAKGDISARNTIPGAFRLVQSIGEAQDIQLIGRGPLENSKTPVMVLVTLNAALQETRRVTDPVVDKFYPNIAYQMADKTLVAFGEGLHSFGQQYRGEVMHLDQKLQALQRGDLEVAGIESSGQIKVACPMGTSDGFLVAKFAFSKDFLDNQSPQGSVLTSFRRGMIIQIVTLK